MNPLWSRIKSLLRQSVEFKYLPFTILVVLSVISLLSRVILMLR